MILKDTAVPPLTLLLAHAYTMTSCLSGYLSSAGLLTKTLKIKTWTTAITVL